MLHQPELNDLWQGPLEPASNIGFGVEDIKPLQCHLKRVGGANYGLGAHFDGKYARTIHS